MEKIVVQEHSSNVSDSVTLPENILSPHHLPSYQPTHWAFVNALLDRVDQLTGGRAGWFQRFFTYVLIGGFAALVNVAVFSLVFYRISLPLSAPNAQSVCKHRRLGGFHPGKFSPERFCVVSS